MHGDRPPGAHAPPPKRRGRLVPSWWPDVYYGWYMAGAGALSNFLVLGIAVFSFGVFVEPITEDTGLSRTELSIIFSIRSFENGLLAPFTGMMVDSFGVRRMALTGVTAVWVGMVMFSQSTTLEAFILASLVLALGQSLGSFTPFSAALMNWFQRNRGRAMGLVSTGNGAGGLAAPILATMIVWLGWRETALIAAGVIAIFGYPLAMTLRSHPQPYGYAPDGVPLEERPSKTPGRQQRPGMELSGATVREALHTPAFYLLALSSGLGGAILVSWIVHGIPHLEERGFSPQTAALIVGIYGVVQIGMRFALGWVGDVFGRRQLFFGGFVLMAIGMLCFTALSPSRVWLVPVYYATFASGHGSFVVMSQTIVADYFGTRRFATIRGLAQSLAMPLGLTFPIFAGAVFDARGDYLIALWGFAGAAVLAAAATLLIRRPPWTEVERQRERADASESPSAAPAG